MGISPDKTLSVFMTDQEYELYKKQKQIIKELVSALEEERKKKVVSLEENPRFKELYSWWQNALEERDKMKNELYNFKEKNKKENWFVKFLRWFAK